MPGWCSSPPAVASTLVCAPGCWTTSSSKKPKMIVGAWLPAAEHQEATCTKPPYYDYYYDYYDDDYYYCYCYCYYYY